MTRIVVTLFPADPLIKDATSLGTAVRAARTSSGLSIADAALTIGVAKQTISDLEAGKPTVGIGLCLKIAAELGVSLLAVPSGNRDVARRRLADLTGTPVADEAVVTSAPRGKRHAP